MIKSLLLKFVYSSKPFFPLYFLNYIYLDKYLKISHSELVGQFQIFFRLLYWFEIIVPKAVGIKNGNVFYTFDILLELQEFLLEGMIIKEHGFFYERF